MRGEGIEIVGLSREEIVGFKELSRLSQRARTCAPDELHKTAALPRAISLSALILPATSPSTSSLAPTQFVRDAPVGLLHLALGPAKRAHRRTDALQRRRRPPMHHPWPARDRFRDVPRPLHPARTRE